MARKSRKSIPETVSSAAVQEEIKKTVPGRVICKDFYGNRGNDREGVR